MTDETIRSALRLANRRHYDDGGEATDETSQEKFLRRELAGSAPQYDPEAGWETAKHAGEMIAGMTTPGAVADFAGYLGGPSALENVRKGNYGSAALQTAGIIPGIGPFAKAERIAREARAAEKPLMALHTTNIDKLDLARRAQGFPATSTGIVDPQYPFSTFGDISLVGDRSWATPKGEKFRVFQGDPWTPNPLLTDRHANEIAEEVASNPYRIGAQSALAPEQVRAYLTPELETFEDVKNKSHLLVSPSKHREYKDLSDEYIQDLKDRMLEHYEGSSISPGSVAHVSMVDPVFRKKNFPNLPSSLEEEIASLPEMVQGAPQSYFESKNYGAANTGESPMAYKGAIVPHHLGPKADKILRDLGITDIYHTDTMDPEKLVRGYEQFKHLQFADGGQVWDKPRPKGLGKPSHLTSKQKASAKAAAKAAGRPYPNLVDNMRAKMAKADGGRTPAWQRSEGKDPEGGLNAKGRAAYNRQNPGKPGLKPPAPHPRTDKDASRRASFCARMKGMKSKLTSSATANDPDSRINKSLRAWNCRADGGPVMHPDIIDALRLADRQFFDDGGFAGKNARYAGRGMNFSPTVPQAAPQVVNSPMAQQAAPQVAQQINPWQISNRNASRDDSRFQDYPKSYPDFEPAVNSQSRPVLKQDTSYSSDQAPQSIPYTGSPIIERYAPQVNSPQSIPYAGNPAIEKYAPPPVAAPAFSPPMAPQQMAGSPSSFAGTPSFSSPAMPQSIPYTGSPVIEQYAPPPTPPLMPAAAPQQSPQSIPYVGNPAIETYAPPTAAPVTPLPQSVAPQQVAAGAASLSGTAPQFAGVPQAANFGNAAAANTALSANQRPAIQNYAGNNYSNMGGNRFPMYPMYPTYSQNRAPFFGKNGGGSNYAAPQAASNPYQRGQNAQRQMPFIGKNGGGSAY